VGRLAEIRIRDNGIGIHPKDLPHIFEPYFRSRSSRCGAQDGSGLGLALAQRLVELHGGTIQAQSDGPGLGTALTVRLPALSEPSSGLNCF
jgi:signal transduction histidine kinase